VRVSAWGEVQQHAGVAFHRSADVAEDHERPTAHAPLPAWQHQQLPRREAAAEGPAQVETRPGARHPAARAPLAGMPGQRLERATRLGELRRREVGEVLLAQGLGAAPRAQLADREVVGSAAVTVIDRRVEFRQHRFDLQ
jgi:hypothetical protein